MQIHFDYLSVRRSPLDSCFRACASYGPSAWVEVCFWGLRASGLYHARLGFFCIWPAMLSSTVKLYDFF